MIDFDRKPSVKGAKELEFEKLRKTYKEQFGKPYVFDFASNLMSWDETIKDIKQCIKDNKPQAEPDYKPGVEY